MCSLGRSLSLSLALPLSLETTKSTLGLEYARVATSASLASGDGSDELYGVIYYCLRTTSDNVSR